MGAGHVTRCRTLALALHARGLQSEFICRRHAGNLIEQVRSDGIAIHELPLQAETSAKAGSASSGNVASSGDSENYAAWLGASQGQDADQSAAVLSGQPDWLVADHYGIGAEWESRLQPKVQRLMAIDDLANRRHDCDLLLDQNFSMRAQRYADLVPARCKLLLGPRYALLRPEYAAQTEERRRDGSIRRVFVFFGGSDPGNLTGRTLEALSQPRLCHWDVDVVVGANYAYGAKLAGQAAARERTRVFGSLPHLAELMARADLAVGAAGSATWERMCVGLPAIVLSIARNQTAGAQALAEQRLVRYLGAAEDLDVSDIEDALASAAAGGGELLAQAERGRLLVDGLGSVRVSECMDPTSATQLHLRRATAADARVYFAWANDPQVRSQALQTAVIPWNTHQEWFASRMADARCHLFVLEARTLPVGQIRFEEEGERVRIDYSIDSQFRGRRWAARLLVLGMRRMAENRRILFHAEVKTSNTASLAAFARLGFTQSASKLRSDLRLFHFDSLKQSLPEDSQCA